VQGDGVTNTTRFFGQFDLSYYVTDDLKLSAGFDYLNETSMGSAEVEYLMHNGAGIPVSLFAKGRFGADSYQQVTGGFRVHFGADPAASLRTRHRTADPDNYTPIFPAKQVTTGQEKSPDVCDVYGPNIFPNEDNCECPTGLAPWPYDEDNFSCRFAPPS